MTTRILQGRYRLDEVVDSGATATVWRAVDEHLDRPVAVKILDGPAPVAGTDEALRFRAEARALARLSHPNIVTVFDSGTADGVAFLVMELIEGRTVRSRLDEGVWTPAEAVAVMAQVCDALSAAHAAGVVHRDIKPGNIVVTPGGIAKLCDFGIARLQDTTALTAPHIAMGTASYMAPEQVTGHPLDGRADLYAVGCVLVEMLTGTPPFTGETAFSVAYQHVHDEPAPLRSRCAGVPSALDTLVARLLAKDPAGRPAGAAQACAELIDSVRAVPVGGKDPATAAPRRTRTRYVWAAAAAAAVAVPALVLAAWPQRQDRAPAVPPGADGLADAVTATATSATSATPTVLPSGPAAVPLIAAAPSSAVRPSAAEPTTPAPVSPGPPGASASSPALTPLEQVAALQAFIRQLSEAGKLPPKDAGDLDKILTDTANRIRQSRIREAQDKIAEARRKNDDLLRANKIAAADHDTIEARLVRLSQSVPSAP